MRKPAQYSLRVLFVCVALVALVAKLYQEFYVPPLTRISGLSVEKQSERNSDVLFNDSATLHTAEQLLAHVTEGSTFWFYDSQKEALSDPGVFVTVTRRAPDYLVEFSNHGWSTGWVVVPKNELAQYVWACRDDNRQGTVRFYRTAGMRLRTEVHPEIRMDEVSASSIQTHIRERIAQAKVDKPHKK